jgi:hypothetical protein
MTYNMKLSAMEDISQRILGSVRNRKRHGPCDMQTNLLLKCKTSQFSLKRFRVTLEESAFQFKYLCAVTHI